MNWTEPLITLALIAGVLLLIPAIWPRYSLFGVQAPIEFRHSAQARRLVKSFRLTVVAGFLLALFVVPFTRLHPAMNLLLPLVLIGFAMAGWGRGYRQTRLRAPVAVPRNAEIEMSPEPDRLPGSLWLAATSLLPIIATLYYLNVHWSSIPAHFPIHWDANGHPNRWAERNWKGVYGLLAFGGLLNSWLSIVAVALWHGSRRSSYRNGSVQVLAGAQLLVAVIVCMVALTPISKLASNAVLPVIIVGVAAEIAFSIWTAVRTNASPGSEADRTPQEAWRGGVLYFNRNDAALAVPRRDGFGFTFNFARPATWALIATLLIIIFASVRWLL